MTHSEKVARFILMNGGGFSEREGVMKLNITSGRNYVNELEHQLQIQLHREKEKTVDGRGYFYRYQCPDKSTAERLIVFINNKAQARGDTGIESCLQAVLLNRFE